MKTTGFDPFTVFRAAAVCFYEGLGGKTLHDSKNLGYCQEFDQVIEQINRLGSDLIEARWDYIVIEEYGEGLLRSAKRDSQVWLKWSGLDRKWKRIGKPIEARGIVDWAI
jgi:hypothetical protein